MTLLPRSLNLRVILLVAVILTVTGIGSGWVSANRESERLLRSMKEYAVALTRNLASGCAHPLILQDYAQLESFILTSAEQSELQGLMVCEPDGRIVSEVRRQSDGSVAVVAAAEKVIPPEPSAPSVSMREGNLAVWQPIVEGTHIGWLRGEYGTGAIEKAQREVWRQSIFLAIIWIASSAGLILIVLRPTVLALEKLSAFARSLNESKGERIEVRHGATEIRALQESLNHASGRLLAAEHQLLQDRERIRASEESHRRLLETVQEGIWVTDRDGITTYVNPRMSEILGYTAEEMLGRKMTDFMAQPPGTAADAPEKGDREEMGHRDQEFIRKDGEPVYTRLETGPILDMAGEYCGAIAAVADITERKAIERIKEEMLSAVSHEMKTPLTAMIGYTELMLTNDLSAAEMKEYAAVIDKEAARLNGLIADFLDIQKQKASAGREDFSPVHLPALLTETAGQFEKNYPGHRFSVETSPGLPLVSGDESLLRRMLEALVSNAVKFSPEGGEVTLRALAEEGGVMISVRDHGIGIRPEELAQVFDLFYRVDNSDRRRFGGTGIGLALVKEIALGHGGRAWAESTPGEGSTFTVCLPLRRGDCRPNPASGSGA